MWIFGSSYEINNFIDFSKKLDSCLNCIYNNAEWIYSCNELLNSFFIKINYYLNINLIFDDFKNFFFYFFILKLFNNDNLLFFYSVLFDLFYYINFVKIFFNSEWLKFFFNSNESIYIYIYHFELLFLNYFFFLKNYLNYSSELYITIFDNKIDELYFNPIILLFFSLLFIIFNLLFLIYYFSFFNSFYKEESFIDNDYLFSALLFESEKEIGSFDDIILSLIFLIFIFGWYFYIHCWSVISNNSDVTLIFFSFPFLYYIILSLPTYLVYNFGLYFVTYLRGSGTSSLILMELMYDYIAFLAFYIRLIVQNVRLILMISTYISLHDLILFYDFDLNFFFCADFIWEIISNVYNSIYISYYYFFSIIIKIIYWLYELFHTFFVVTAQTIAFFAMVFWLFLFLYTFFVLEKIENYFKEKRIKSINI